MGTGIGNQPGHCTGIDRVCMERENVVAHADSCYRSSSHGRRSATGRVGGGAIYLRALLAGMCGGSGEAVYSCKRSLSIAVAGDCFCTLDCLHRDSTELPWPKGQMYWSAEWWRPDVTAESGAQQGTLTPADPKTPDSAVPVWALMT